MKQNIYKYNKISITLVAYYHLSLIKDKKHIDVYPRLSLIYHEILLYL